MKRFLIALQFLTTLPIGVKSEPRAKDIGASLIYFPVVGGLIGLWLAFIAIFFSFLPRPVTAVLILAGSIIITGGIHLDGFADSCDGLYGHRTKRQMLDIMRDSRIGVMGVIGIVSLLLFKFAVLVSLPQNILWKSLIMMAVFARWAQVLACNASTYAREEGKARYFIEYARRRGLFTGGLFTLALFLLLAGINGVILFFITILTLLLIINRIKRKLGGMTGDTIGGVNEAAEALILFFYFFIVRLSIC